MVLTLLYISRLVMSVYLEGYNRYNGVMIVGTFCWAVLLYWGSRKPFSRMIFLYISLLQNVFIFSFNLTAVLFSKIALDTVLTDTIVLFSSAVIHAVSILYLLNVKKRQKETDNFKLEEEKKFHIFYSGYYVGIIADATLAIKIPAVIANYNEITAYTISGTLLWIIFLIWALIKPIQRVFVLYITGFLLIGYVSINGLALATDLASIDAVPNLTIQIAACLLFNLFSLHAYLKLREQTRVAS